MAWPYLLLAALLAVVPAAHAQWESLVGSPSAFLAGPVQATLTVAGDEVATSGTFRRRDDDLDATVKLLRLQYHRDLPRVPGGLLADWALRGMVSYSDFRSRSRFPGLAYGMSERIDARILSVGIKGSRGWGEHLYGLVGLSLHIGRFRESADFGTMPNADLVYAGLNNRYINTAVRTASVTARLGVGWRQSLDRGRRLHGLVEGSILPLYTRTVGVESGSQHFSATSSSLHFRAGLEWRASMHLFDRPVTLAPSYARRQYFDRTRPLEAASLHEASLDVLLAPAYRHRALDGLGLGVAWMRSGAWSGWRIEIKGLFG